MFDKSYISKFYLTIYYFLIIYLVCNIQWKKKKKIDLFDYWGLAKNIEQTVVQLVIG